MRKCFVKCNAVTQMLLAFVIAINEVLINTGFSITVMKIRQHKCNPKYKNLMI